MFFVMVWSMKTQANLPIASFFFRCVCVWWGVGGGGGYKHYEYYNLYLQPSADEDNYHHSI